MTGNVSLTIGGNTEALTAAAYGYHGKINETQYQLLEVRFDTTQWVDGDELVIEAGTYFYLPAVDKYIYFDEAYSVENCEVTLSGSNFTVNSNRGYLYNGERIGDLSTAVSSGAMVLKGTVLTVSAAAHYNITTVDVTGAADNGNYQYTVNGSTTLNVVTEPKTYTATVTATNANVSVSGLSIGNNSVKYGQTYDFKVTANSGYKVMSVKIDTVEQGTGGSYSITVGGDVSIEIEVKRIINVTINKTADITVTQSPTEVLEGDTVTFTLSANSGVRFYETSNGETQISSPYTITAGQSDITLSFKTKYQVTVTTDGATVSGISNGWYDYGTKFTPKVSYENNNNQSFTVTINGTSYSEANKEYTITGTTTVNASSKSCLVEGTMILMADGTQKAVENIVVGDKVMVFNHETGKYEAGTIWFNDHADDPAMVRRVINLEFANGAKARIAYEHGYFDLDLMKYVFIREDNMQEFIGHRFVTSSYNGTEMVQGETTLVKAYITEEVVKVYGPITEYHFNLISDDMLSMPSFNFDASGMVNIFDYDEDLSYNEEKMQADIEQYGVFTYEEFSEYMSYEDYCKAPIQYFKVAIGKGNLTWEQIELTLQYLAVNEFAG